MDRFWIQEILKVMGSLGLQLSSTILKCDWITKATGQETGVTLSILALLVDVAESLASGASSIRVCDLSARSLKDFCMASLILYLCGCAL